MPGYRLMQHERLFVVTNLRFGLIGIQIEPAWAAVVERSAFGVAGRAGFAVFGNRADSIEQPGNVLKQARKLRFDSLGDVAAECEHLFLAFEMLAGIGVELGLK